MELTAIDDLLLQEIYSLKEKLKIAVYHIKQLEPDFEVDDYMHRLNSVEFDQWMEELSAEQNVRASVSSFFDILENVETLKD